jgi:hypothetical protein
MNRLSTSSFASENLTDAMVKCAVHKTEHGSDHRAIETVLDTPWPAPKYQERLLFKNAPWKEINARIASTLAATPSEGTAQQKTDRLMSVVGEAVHALTPKAKASPYAKRWWTADLTQLRQIHTYWRNHARSERRAGRNAPHLEQMAGRAANNGWETRGSSTTQQPVRPHLGWFPHKSERIPIPSTRCNFPETQIICLAFYIHQSIVQTATKSFI